ncbi:phage tail spike protein [Enterococcus faecalis]|uniref:phage tail spike protein n=1 Tax=Enterococcus faecalis TaxID=1351 RepID=UPI003D0A8EA3
MSTIILHDKKNNEWSSLGLGPLKEAINPTVVRERNGIYDMTFQYPVVGKLFHELKVGRWIVADAGPTLVAKSQRFEIAKITKPIKGIVTVYCEHYRYKLLRTMVKIGSKYSNISAQAALNQLRSQMEPKSDFAFYSDVGTTSSIDFTDPAKYKNAQEVLGGVAGSILDNFGGEYLFNNNQVRLLAKAGTDTNVVIAYGKNLTDINQEESIENTYTSVYGWAKIGNGDDEKIITLPEVYIDSDYVGNYTERKIQMVDFSDKEPKDVEALRGMVKSFIKSNNVGIPRVSIKASYVDLASSVSNEQLKNLEIVDLCDWVTVTFNQLNINATAQIIKTVWNNALDRYESIELGEARTDFAKIMDDSKTTIDNIDTKVDWLEKAQKEASDIIKNPGKGHVIIYPSIADPQELLIMDTTNINTASKVWRWNVGGLGFSSTGYNGTYELAMTNNGAIVADRMTTGTLRAINIVGVAISSSTFETSGINGKVHIADGIVQFIDRKGKEFGYIYPANVDSPHNILEFSCRDAINISAGAYYGEPGKIAQSSIVLNSGYRDDEATIDLTAKKSGIRLIAAYDFGGHSIIMDKKGVYMDGGLTLDKFLTVNNNTVIDFYNHLNMHGYKIMNVSDIRLKENIENTRIDGIKETKKLNFVEFNRKQNYQSKDKRKQPPKSRELGLIAQYSPFLCADSTEQNDHYLRLDMNKQIMLNSLTNKQLIEYVEKLEQRLVQLEQAQNKGKPFSKS